MKKPKERLKKFKGPKIGSKLRIRLPADYGVTQKPIPSLFNLPDYNPSQHEKENLKKWCIEQASLITKGNSDTPCVIKDAEKIYDWVRK